MASWILFDCSCGKRHMAYLSKARQARTRGLSELEIATAEQADREERAAGEIAAGRETARLAGSMVWDTDETPVIVCSCGNTIDAGSLVQLWERQNHDPRL